jgi:hypothetical protein
MKKQVLTFTLCFLAAMAFARGPISQGQGQLNAGVGLSSWGTPFYLGFDYGVHPDITLGGELSYRNYDDYYLDDRYYHSIIGISGNGNYHFNNLLGIPRNWDFYAGLNLGFYIWNSPDDYYGSETSELGLGAQIGGRYYFNDKIGLNLEFGSGNAFSGGKFGISIRL